jgi:hypothetical protein
MTVSISHMNIFHDSLSEKTTFAFELNWASIKQRWSSEPTSRSS